MTPDPPIPRRRQAGRLLIAGGAAAAAAALALTGGLPASAGSAASTGPAASAAPTESGQEHPTGASARIAYVDSCGRGAIGRVGTGDGAVGDTAADWSEDPSGVAGDVHFAAEPDNAYSSVIYDGGRLTAAAGVAGVRFTPDCRADGPVPSARPRVTDAFGRDSLLELDSASSTAWWSAASGSGARITVRGLEILGRTADVSDGDYTGTFTADSGDGQVTVSVTARRRVDAPEEGGPPPASGGPPPPERAGASLSVRFEVARVDADGDPVSEFHYGVEFAGTAVRIPAGGVPETPGPGAATAAPDPGPTVASPASPASPGVPEETGDAPEDPPPAARSDDAEDPEPTSRPGTAAGATRSAEPPPGARGASGDPAPRESATGPTVAAPTVPEHAPSVDPGSGGTNPAGGRLPVAGSALIGLVATGLAALGGGGTAIYLGRGRKSGFDGDDVAGSRAPRTPGRDRP
ncbi:hypothetical protein [Streptomonospora salina]|uniref:Uncharacterized protein n=1 Tax=Streptomonospora salina TaxID=104205 RepID=A0A841ELS9_9ACTN|nr:hypothetical protein [Streptomonospora salina]MBB6000371.1 hypothetical protein [Streptomonospora salina]